ncbi:MAG: transposase [Clostridia bacterium]|nr:transposase [Clostridia bacterium]
MREHNKSMADASLGRFLTMLAYKAEEAGCELVSVNPRGTTQECSRCGKTDPKTLYERTHSCPHCGLVMDRDQNAAINTFSGASPWPDGNRPRRGGVSDLAHKPSYSVEARNLVYAAMHRGE